MSPFPLKLSPIPCRVYEPSSRKAPVRNLSASTASLSATIGAVKLDDLPHSRVPTTSVSDASLPTAVNSHTTVYIGEDADEDYDGGSAADTALFLTQLSENKTRPPVPTSNGRRGFSFLSEMQERQAELKADLGEYVSEVKKTIDEGQRGLSHADFNRMVHELMVDPSEYDEDEDDDMSITSAEVDRYMNPFLNHPDERVRKGYERIMALDRQLDDKIEKVNEFQRKTFPEEYHAKIDAATAKRHQASIKKMERQKRHRRRMAVLRRILEDSPDEGGELDEGDGQSTATGVTGTSRLSSLSRFSVKSSLKPEEEELVERLLATMDEDGNDIDPYSMEDDDDAFSEHMSTTSGRSVQDIDSELSRFRMARGAPEETEEKSCPSKDYLREQRQEKENKQKESEIERKLREIRLQSADNSTGELPREVLAELLQDGLKELGFSGIGSVDDVKV